MPFNKGGSDRTRQEYTRSFSSICVWLGIIENSKIEVKLNEVGKSLLENSQNVEKINGNVDEKNSTNMPLPQITQANTDLPTNQNNSQPPSPIPINTSVAISISVDTKDQNSVDNFFKIIKALKGETQKV